MINPEVRILSVQLSLANRSTGYGRLHQHRSPFFTFTDTFSWRLWYHHAHVLMADSNTTMPFGAVLRVSLNLGSTLTLLGLFWAQLARSRQQSHKSATYMSSHVFFNTLSLVIIVFAIGSHFWEALSTSTPYQRLEDASCTAAWVSPDLDYLGAIANA